MDMDWNQRLKTIKLLNFESEHQILEVTDPDLASDCQMEPGMIYVYYKPSIVNGYNSLQSMANVNMYVSQAILKNYFTAEMKVNSEQLDKLDLDKMDQALTEKTANELFGLVFQTVFNETFSYNPNIRQMKRKLRGEESSEKPILFIYYQRMFMDMLNPQFQKVFQKYSDFDIYYTDDEKVAQEFVILEKYPPVIPNMYIFDTMQQVPVKTERLNSPKETVYGKYHRPVIP
jgi:hypothetical protein